MIPDLIQQGAAWAPYCGAAPTPAEWPLRWNFDPILLAALLTSGFVAYRLTARERRLPLALAYVLAFVLFVSPFCALTSALFAARVTHHVLLTAALAPLLAMAWPRVRWPGSLALWTAGHALLFWFWHAPAPYAAALSHDGVYWLMQVTLLGSAFGFWSAVMRASVPAAVAGLLVTMVQMGLLGALLTFAGRPLYTPHFATTLPWGYTPLADQQLAGLIMWAPAAGFYLAAALLMLGRWLAREEPIAAAPR